MGAVRGTQPLPRAYESPLRAEQRERTRARILAAATQLLADEGLEELTIPLVARNAGVSVRTVYVHFPAKDDLLEAVARALDATIGAIEYPDGPDELPAFVRGLFESFEREEPLFRAALNSKAGWEVRSTGRSRRLGDLEHVLRSELEPLEPLERRQALAAIYLMQSLPAWQAMKDYLGLDGAQAGTSAAWAVRALVRELRRRPAGLREKAP
jgi:AcrR family transcriptional regulator